MNLTSLARTKTYLGLTTVNSDAVVSQLIARSSDQVSRWCSRSFQSANYSGARLNGTGTRTLRIPDDPVLEVTAVTIGNTVIPTSADSIASGYQHDAKYLYLFGGYAFPMGFRNILVSYSAGYVAQDSEFIPAAPGPYTVTPVAGGYASADLGVTYTATGVALALVGSAPSSGHYSFNGGVYTFAAADAGLQVTMSYDYVPGAVEQATIEISGTMLKQRDNLGINSKGLAGESISYSDKTLSESAKGLLAQYRKVVAV